MFQALTATEVGHEGRCQCLSILHRIDAPVGEAAFVPQSHHVIFDIRAGRRRR